MQLTTANIQAYLREVELPRRHHGFPGQEAAEVLRYGAFVGSELECHERLGRAMEHCRLHIDRAENDGRAVKNGRIILAQTLTGSKGRFTRHWHAPPGGLWGCLLHASTLSPQSTMLLSIALGVAACEALRQVGAENAVIRWVNDVLVDDEKIAGFLVESHTGPRWGEVFHLVGFGINVNNRDFPPDLRQIATSLKNKLGRSIDLTEFTLDFVAKLVWNIGLLYFIEARRPDWADEGERFLHPILQSWKNLSDTLGRKVIYGYDVLAKPQYTATITGVGYDGGLQMVLEDGTKITEHSGEIRYI